MPLNPQSFRINAPFSGKNHRIKMKPGLPYEGYLVGGNLRTAPQGIPTYPLPRLYPIIPWWQNPFHLEPRSMRLNPLTQTIQ
jgi:hypothetical protein